MSPKSLTCEACGSSDVQTKDAEPGKETEAVCQECEKVMTMTRVQLTDVFGGGDAAAASRMAYRGDEFSPEDVPGASSEDSGVVTFDLSGVEEPYSKHHEIGVLAMKTALEYNVNFRYSYVEKLQVVVVRFTE